MSYQFQATEKFWKEFYALSPEQKEAVRAKWETFKADPCHPTLDTHIVWPLSAIARHRIYSAVIEKDLRIRSASTENWSPASGLVLTKFTHDGVSSGNGNLRTLVRGDIGKE